MRVEILEIMNDFSENKLKDIHEKINNLNGSLNIYHSSHSECPGYNGKGGCIALKGNNSVIQVIIALHSRTREIVYQNERKDDTKFILINGE